MDMTLMRKAQSMYSKSFVVEKKISTASVERIKQSGGRFGFGIKTILLYE